MFNKTKQSHSAMEEMSDRFRGAFQSKRLVYTALEDNESGRELWSRCTSTDPVAVGLASPSTFKPPVQADSDQALAERLRDPLLAVVIRLPPSGGGGDGQPDAIGFLVLNKSFPRACAVYLGILSQHQNKGYGREAINWAVDWAFTWADVHRVAIGTSSFNSRALHLYDSMGFKKDGCLRECFYMNRQWHDLVEFSMLESDWLQLRESKAQATQGGLPSFFRGP